LELSLRYALNVSEPFGTFPLEKRFSVGTSKGAYRHSLIYIALRLMSNDSLVCCVTPHRAEMVPEAMKAGIAELGYRTLRPMLT